MIKENLLADIKSAMKSGDKTKLSTLRFLSSKIKDAEIAKKARETGLSEEETAAIVRKLVKQGKDSLSSYRAGNREDLAEKTAAELKILEDYMPSQLSIEQLDVEVDAALKELKVSDRKGFGQVMGFLTAKLGASADPKAIASILGKKLSS